MKVDFPQPDGPISAVTVPDQKSRDISLRTSLSPNQAWTPRASSPTPRAPDPGFFFAAALAATVSDKGIVTFDYKTKVAGSYLFGTTSYALVDTKQKDADTAKAVRDLLSYLLDPKCPQTDPKQEFTTITGALRDVNLKLIAKITN